MKRIEIEVWDSVYRPVSPVCSLGVWNLICYKVWHGLEDACPILTLDPQIDF